jgi:hypothetical protein
MSAKCVKQLQGSSVLGLRAEPLQSIDGTVEFVTFCDQECEYVLGRHLMESYQSLILKPGGLVT